MFRTKIPKTEFSDHGVSIPLRILTKFNVLERLPFYLHYYTMVYIIIFPLFCVIHVCTLSVTLLSRLIPFFDWLSRIFQTLSTVFFLGVYVSVRACVWDVSEASVVVSRGWWCVIVRETEHIKPRTSTLITLENSVWRILTFTSPVDGKHCDFSLLNTILSFSAIFFSLILCCIFFTVPGTFLLFYYLRTRIIQYY